MDTQVQLPPAIADFITAKNSHAVSAFLALFTDSAVVKDDGGTNIGKRALKAWVRKINAYNSRTEIIDYVEDKGQHIMNAQVVGNFARSPAQVRYVFRMKDDKIDYLRAEYVGSVDANDAC